MKRQKGEKLAESKALDAPVHVNGSSRDTWHFIATTAYDLYVQRGREDGHDVEDWLRAEAIVTRQAGR